MKDIFCLIVSLVIAPGLFAQTSDRVIYEKVYLHTDRDYYTDGEDILFKAYIVDARSNTFIDLSNNLYVELISPDAKISGRIVIRTDNGYGKGSFTLKDSVPTGKYRIRAYTNRMKNFEDSFVFQKLINVYGSSKTQPVKKPSALVSVSQPQQTVLPVNATSKNRLTFFPEAGSLIENVASVVAFKSENEKGEGLALKGVIVTSQGDSIAEISCNSSGFGRLFFKPLPGLTYTAQGAFSNDEKFKIPVPKAQANGITFSVRNTDSILKVFISTNEITFPQIKDTDLLIVCRQKNESKLVLKKKVTNSRMLVEIPHSKFLPGIVTITVYDNKFKPQAERLVFIPGNEYKLEIKSDKQEYSAKEKVNVRLKLTDINNQPLKANLSFSAIDGKLIPQGIENIATYLMLQSEIKGEIDSIAKYLDPTNKERYKQLDVLLMTQGWRDFVWKNNAGSGGKPFFSPEKGFTVSGRVRQLKNDIPMPGMNITLMASQALGNKLFTAVTDSSGRFYIDRVFIPQSSMIRLTSVDKKGKKSGWIILDSLYTEPLPVVSDFSTSDTLNDSIVQALIHRGFMIKEAKLADTITLKEVLVKGTANVKLFDQVLTPSGYEDKSFIITEQDARAYRNLRHFLLTKVEGASPDTSYRNGVIFNFQGRGHYPKFIIDRNEDTFDQLFYYDLYIEDINKIVIKQMVGIGNGSNSTSSGPVYLIYLTLKPSAYGREELSVLNASVTGYSQDKVFYSPAYPDNSNSTIRDLRTTLHWEPIITTNKDGEAFVHFYNDDIKSKIKIVVEGITEKGIPVVGSVNYEID
ncbi:MG2 domain-containing protein [Pedobacter sp. P351]|uniref:MG2 domain-containing protein n=1 Tax=Pedobacter superstes TaxID=3133441 RepID=UPI0030A7F3C8